MKLFSALLTLLFAANAHAGFDCNVSIIKDGIKVFEGKIDLKADAKNKELGSAEKDGYLFELVSTAKSPSQIEKLIVTEKSSTRRSLTSFAGLNPTQPDSVFSTALLEDKTGPMKPTGARMSCKPIK